MHHLTKEERVSQGRDAIRLIEQFGMKVAAVARRKGVAFNTIKDRIREARKHQ